MLCLSPYPLLASDSQGSRQSGSGKSTQGGGGWEAASLGLLDGSELLVEEQGAVSKLIMEEGCASLADMEVGDGWEKGDLPRVL